MATDTAGLPAPVYAEYEPVCALGSGGEAQLVMLVRHRATGEQRVVKVYSAAVRPDPELFGRLRDAQREHLVQLHDWGEHTDPWGTSRCWEVLEYVAGGSLADLIKANGPRLPDALVRAVLNEVAAALTYLHRDVAERGQAGIAHRDVKPENVLVRSREPLDLVLCDFGLVTAVRATRPATGRAGTPLYQAPETWWRMSAEPPQDWWALGVMVAEMLIGRNPNAGPDGSTPTERVLFEHLATHDVDLSEVGDARWRLLCMGLLTRSPEHRWGPAEVADWLAGGSPPVHTGDPQFLRAPPEADRPFEIAGTLCTSVAELAHAMHGQPQAAADVFLDRGRCADLRAWLDDNFGGGGIPIDLVRVAATSQQEANHRVARLVSLAAPHLPARYAGHPADAPGLANLARLAATGDAAAASLVEQVDGWLLTTLARHDSRLLAAAPHLDPALAGLRQRLRELESGTYAADGTREAIAEAGRTASAVVLGAVVAPASFQAMRKGLRRQRRARRSAWWAALAEDAATATGRGDQIPATVLATLLAPAAVAERAVQRKAARTRSREARPPTGRALRADTANLLVGIVLGYLATFIALTGYVAFAFEYDSASAAGAAAAAFISRGQASLLPPLAVLLGCLLVRPADPARSLNQAVALVIAVPCAAVAAIWSGNEHLAGYPVTVSPLVHEGLIAVNGWIGHWVAPVALFICTPTLFYLIARLRSRSWRTPSARRRPAATTLRLAVALSVVVAYLAGVLQIGPPAVVDSFPVVLLP